MGKNRPPALRLPRLAPGTRDSTGSSQGWTWKAPNTDPEAARGTRDMGFRGLPSDEAPVMAQDVRHTSVQGTAPGWMWMCGVHRPARSHWKGPPESTGRVSAGTGAGGNGVDRDPNGAVTVTCKNKRWAHTQDALTTTNTHTNTHTRQQGD
jgi:hypothetical protein